MPAVPQQFRNPDDFAPVKRRPGRFYCKLCTPPGYAEGQAMNLSAALSHEQHDKHQLKVRERENEEEEWYLGPPINWYAPTGPSPWEQVASTAWEKSYPSERADEFIQFWLDNLAAAARGKALETMDSFIDRYNKKWRDWFDDGATDEAVAADKVEEVEEDGCNGIPGIWYDGGSFHPDEEGFDGVGGYLGAVKTGMRKRQWRAAAVHEDWLNRLNIWLGEHNVRLNADPREEYLAWGFSPEECQKLGHYAITSNYCQRRAEEDPQSDGWKVVARRKTRGHMLEVPKAGIIDGRLL